MPEGGRTPTIALDGRGTDAGAGVIAEGAALAAADGIGVRVFGDSAALAALGSVTGVEVIDSQAEISNEEEPVAAVRARADASIVMAAADAADGGKADALVSAGPTGATMTAALFAMRRLRGIRRPALALQLVVPGSSGPPTVLLDVGANSEVRAHDLVQFAVLGAAFASAVLGVTDPRVALLSVGEEPKKGTPIVVEAHEALRATAGIRFAGNVEGRDLLAGTADVIVCDGFTGNVALKTLEGTAKAVADAVSRAARSNPLAAAGGLLLRPALGGLRRELDPNAVGGAILLGLRGVAVVAHGSSSAEGIANAVRLAASTVSEGAVERTGELLEHAGAAR